MTPAALGLLLLASVAHALWNIAAQSVSGKGYAFVLAYHGRSAVLLAPIAIWLLVIGAHEFNLGLLGAAALITILIAVVFLGERPTPPETIGAFIVLA